MITPSSDRTIVQWSAAVEALLRAKSKPPVRTPPKKAPQRFLKVYNGSMWSWTRFGGFRVERSGISRLVSHHNVLQFLDIGRNNTYSNVCDLVDSHYCPKRLFEIDCSSQAS